MPRPAVRPVLATLALLSAHTSLLAAGVQLLPAIDSPSGGSGSVVLEPVQQRSQPTRRLVYSCVVPGLVTFSDRPCGPLPEVRELHVPQPPPTAAGAATDPGKSSKGPGMSAPKSAGGNRANPGDDDDEPDADTTCQKLQATLDSIDSRMRAGYSAREAGRLWERWRAAKARLQEAGC